MLTQYLSVTVGENSKVAKLTNLTCNGLAVGDQADKTPLQPREIKLLAG